MSVHFSSATDLWSTPQAFFDRCAERWQFTLDVCATADNAKCAHFFTKEDDGLAQPWDGVCWMNPPYGREIGRWMRKAYESSTHGATVVCLVPARTDTAWWHEYAMKGQIEFIRGRLKFGGSANSAPFPSALVTFSPTAATPPQPPAQPHHTAAKALARAKSDAHVHWLSCAEDAVESSARALLAAGLEGFSKAAADVLAERKRQVSVEGWTPEHDDEHDDGEMARAAACYANPEIWNVFGSTGIGWPWAPEWWKPKDNRRNLERAAALIIAEIERIDRAATQKGIP